MSDQIENSTEQLNNTQEENLEQLDDSQGIEAQQAYQRKWGGIIGMIGGALIGGKQGAQLGAQLGNLTKW